MSEPVKLPPKPQMGRIVEDGDLVASTRPADRDARRFSMIVAAEALERMGPAAIEFVTRELADQIRHEQHGAVTEVVQRFLLDRAWAEPIIREAIRDTVREFIRDMLASSPASEERRA